GKKIAVFENYPFFIVQLLFVHFTDQAFLSPVIVLPGALQFGFYLKGNERITVNLAVRVGHRYPYFLPLILEGKHILNLPVPRYFIAPFDPEIDYLPDM